MANSWQLEEEKFLKSKEFDGLCSTKASMYFDKGFDGCLAQFMANGYSEEEHPASFLDVEQALADMPDDEDLDDSSSEGLREKWLVRNWTLVPSWSGLCAHVEELREEWPVRNWTLSADWSGLCAHIEVLREKWTVRNWTSSAELVGLMCSRRRATREVASTNWYFECRAGRAYVLTQNQLLLSQQTTQQSTQQSNSASAQLADNSALTNENSAFGDENSDLAHEFQQLLQAYRSTVRNLLPLLRFLESNIHRLDSSSPDFEY
ncbi:SPX domain-containing membrane protein [Dorcoceras hygrometricum]|uniref:SPX domain-containing membrane protein n=1 Tax=Dorcoceras hygrometricum TaxID=472368 RepID=A0A2Z7B1X8_9LAMI|nr:SPX domain-containing membrane protein [Dorcoceras hygrometricum]